MFTPVAEFVPAVQLSNRMPFAQIESLLRTRGCATVILPGGRRGYLDSVQREDGSGKSFNLTVKGLPGLGETVYLYVRTTD